MLARMAYAVTCPPVRLGAAVCGPDVDQLFLIIRPECPVDVCEPDLITAVNALGVDGEKHFDAVPGPLCDLGCWHASVKPQ
jgi:hypothetical protein